MPEDHRGLLQRGASLVGWSLIAVTASLIAFYASGYVTGAPDTFRLSAEEGEVWAFRLHAGGGGLALVLGAMQFLSPIRRHLPALHRWSGRVYVLAVLGSATGALVMAQTASGGGHNMFAFISLALFWLFTTGMALQSILTGKVEAHRRWMVRSYAMTFAAVTLRVGIPGLIIYGGFSEAEAYSIVAWASWCFNLFFAEWFILRRG